MEKIMFQLCGIKYITESGHKNFPGVFNDACIIGSCTLILTTLTQDRD